MFEFPVWFGIGGWWFAVGKRKYGPYRSQEIAEDRREAVKAYTSGPLCHHQHPQAASVPEKPESVQ